MYTSLKLSKLLAENGCCLESGMYWSSDKAFHEDDMFHLAGKIDEYSYGYPAYDILNDLCVKYAKEVFGEPGRGGLEDPAGYHSQNVLALMQMGGEPDDYIWEHCTFNPKNQ